MSILVTTDGSERSLTAISHGSRLAAALGCPLVLGHVVDPLLDLAGEIATSVDVAAGNVAARWRRELTVLLDRLSLAGDVRVAIKRRTEPLPEAVLRLARDSEAVAIAMATRGTGALRHAAIGSTAMGVITARVLPVLAAGDRVSEPSRSSGPYRVLATTDGSEASRPALTALAGLLPAGSVEVRLLRVCEPGLPNDETEASCRAQLEAAHAILPPDLDVQDILRPMEPRGVPATILAVAEESGVDAIAMATHGHSPLRHLFAGSVALQVLAQSRWPLLLTRS